MDTFGTALKQNEEKQVHIVLSNTFTFTCMCIMCIIDILSFINLLCLMIQAKQLGLQRIFASFGYSLWFTYSNSQNGIRIFVN